MGRGGGMGALRHGETLGGKPTPEYRLWLNMRDRCRNPNNGKFKFYGGRGISVCEKWNSFEAFLADVGRRPSPQHSIDRYPNPNGNYEPTNVRWATRAEQFINRDCTIWVNLNGARITLQAACAITGIPYNAARKRIKRGWSPLVGLRAGDGRGGLVAFFDGCTEPINPGGTGGYGAVVMRGEARLFEKSGLVPAAPTNSNNVAEYLAVTAVLDWLLANEPTAPATIFGDSRLVICQLWGWPPGKRLWKIGGVDVPDRPKGFYAPYAVAAREKLRSLRHARGYWIPREMNGIADELSKAELRKAGVEFRIQPEEDE